MYIITYKEKPATLDRLYQVEETEFCTIYHSAYGLSEAERDMYVTSAKRKYCVDFYLHHFGFTWEERARGIEIRKIQIPLDN